MALAFASVTDFALFSRMVALTLVQYPVAAKSHQSVAPSVLLLLQVVGRGVIEQSVRTALVLEREAVLQVEVEGAVFEQRVIRRLFANGRDCFLTVLKVPDSRLLLLEQALFALVLP